MGALEWASHCDLRAGVGVCAIRWLSRVVVASIVVLGSTMAQAAAQLPRSVLILDQSARDSVWFDAFFSGFRSTLNTQSAKTRLRILGASRSQPLRGGATR